MSIHEQTATELLAALRDKHLTSVEIVRAMIARREAVGKKTNAIVIPLDESALAAAASIDLRRARGEDVGPLGGLPVTVKENIEIAGTAATLGLESRRTFRSTHDAVTIRLLKSAGAVVLGKTNIPQTLIAMETTNHVYGTTNNPWAHDRTPGGSSGGEAAAIASGQSVLGIGTDIGGSVRIPAAYTGLTTLKPSLHRWSNRGSIGILAGQELVRSQMGPLARNVADLTLLFRSIDTTEHARFDPECPPVPMGDPASIDVRKLRVGVFETDGFITPCATARRAVREASAILERAGARVTTFAPPRANEHYLLMAAAMSADGMATMGEALGKDPVIAALKLNARIGRAPRQVLKQLAKVARRLGEKRLADVLDVGGRKSVQELWALCHERTTMQRAELDAWNAQELDLVLCPAAATPAPPHGTTGDFTPAAIYTIRYNLLNLPAGVVPVTRVSANETARPEQVDRIDKKAALIQRESAGLPIGVQIVGRPFREDTVLAAMAVIEAGAMTSDSFPRTPLHGG